MYTADQHGDAVKPEMMNPHAVQRSLHSTLTPMQEDSLSYVVELIFGGLVEPEHGGTERRAISRQ